MNFRGKRAYFHSKFLLSFLLVIVFLPYLSAQERKAETTPETKEEKKQEKRLYSLTQFGHETYLFVKQPVKWVRSDWLKLGIVTAATAIVLPFDERIISETRKYSDYYYSAPVVAGRVYGEWYSIGGVAGAFGLYGVIARDTAAKKIAIELFQAGIYSEIITTMFKIAIGRARPVKTNDAFTFRPLTFFDNNFLSMPSGHTTSAMALSTVMSRHAHTTALKIIAYLPAALTMFSRIYQNKHWMSDVIPGAAIGYFAGNWVVDLHEGKRHRINVISGYPVTTITFCLDREPGRRVIIPKY